LLPFVLLMKNRFGEFCSESSGTSRDRAVPDCSLGHFVWCGQIECKCPETYDIEHNECEVLHSFNHKRAFNWAKKRSGNVRRVRFALLKNKEGLRRSRSFKESVDAGRRTSPHPPIFYLRGCCAVQMVAALVKAPILAGQVREERYSRNYNNQQS
jgi:hypothetical protein